ncbi:MAG: glycosyltransferase family 4 protein [Candidatus Bathyarchaeia archaeon]|nr:glycosyltransferase family 4 protein [Candidatus Bathyarchaeota archaeon]
MNICMITWEYPPRIVGGIARHCSGLAGALAKLGHSVHIVTLDFPGAPSYEEIEGVRIYRTPIELGHPNFIVWTLIFNHFIEKRVAMLSRDVKFDILHAHDWLVAPASIASKHYLRLPLVSTIHSTEVGRSHGLHNPDSYLIDGVEWWLTYESKRIIVTSNAMKREVEDHFHLPSEKIDIIPNAIDASKYNIPVDRGNVKRRFGIDPSERIVLFVGRLVPQKGVEYLIMAAPKIVERHPEARIVIVGDGWSKDYLLSLAASTGCQHKITFLGFISDQDLIEIMLSSDVLVVPSIYEPFGIVALEGMAAGIPIVASNTGGLAEIIEHDRTGFLAYKENPDSIAWGVNRILSDPGYASWLVQNAKRKIREVYSWDAVARRTIETYERALRE